ncbi:Carboxypeptidase regulatory-like domain-containing protein [Micromonospora inositola]|uniref:Carboxypeptidase regulatory-like domain-containing protein n=1 Tax=Micromonospora inositola TaxID=47865 RepID=A0A1C5HR89_9ACTN|nr:carboxypeptidase regulatory-like domain-containing protein [Micromonospora inositola]SCG48413.1 Carboxypeptidase regulatory-like domain-containing protein [Micromonospora inositola]
MNFTLNFTDPISTPADVTVTSDNPKLSCVDGCSRNRVDKGGNYDATFKLADDAANGSAVITVRAVDSMGPKQEQTASTTVTLVAKAAPPQVQTVKSISGKVVITANGDPVPNATVMLLDSQQHQYSTVSDGSGNYRFTGSTSNPITPGRIELGAIKDTFKGTKTVNASAGQSVTGQRIALPIKVEVSPSASPSASEETAATDEATDDAATDEPATDAPAGQQAAANQDSGASWLLILLGGLFVAVGVGTIVLLYMRRKNEGDDVDGDGPGGPGPMAGAGAVPGARGGYRGADDHTRVVNGMGAGPAPTMAGGTSLSDAPTMMHRPVDDVPPDPYGAPPPSYGPGGQPGWAGNGYGEEAPGQGGYGAANGYGNAPSSGGGYGNSPSSGGGYGSRDYGAGAAGYPPAQGAGGYGEPAQGGGYGERYDEPTGRYAGEGTQSYAPPADPYPTSTYQPPEQGRGYGQPDPGQYGQGPEPTNGYGAGAGGYGAPAGGYDNAPAGNGYDNPPAGGGYDNGQQQGYGGYDQRGGYGGDGYGQPQQGGHGQQGGYGQEQPPPQRNGGYDQGGYDQSGYYGDPAQAGRGRPDAPQERGGRRLDWLDD